jgi:gluconate 2-dehydrogenase gamma chain
MPRLISRRDLLRGAGVIGTAAVVPSSAREPGHGLADGHAAGAAQAQGPAAAAPTREALENLGAAEAVTLEAIVARLIPTDENGPGASEARAARYIDRALGGALAASREAYRSGLASLDRYARGIRGAAFADLSAPDQDAILGTVEAGEAAGFADASAFFTMVRTHTLQGTFGDPYYGGNANYVGWDLIGYPGVRIAVSPADQQRLERDGLTPNHRSAYDHEQFDKATAAGRTEGGERHGD